MIHAGKGERAILFGRDGKNIDSNENLKRGQKLKKFESEKFGNGETFLFKFPI